MEKRKVRSVSFDTMVKFFMQNYNIPTKKDFDKIFSKLERIEKQLQLITSGKKSANRQTGTGKKPTLTASDQVMDAITKSGDKGADFVKIKAKTGFEDKKLRNIIYRMDKAGKITRKSRGIYIISK